MIPDAKRRNPLIALAGRVLDGVHQVVVACFVIMLLIMLFQILARYVLRIAVPWTDEASRYFFIWEIFFGAAIAQRYGGHIRITVLTERLSPRVNRILDFISSVVTLLVVGLLAIGAYEMMGSTRGIYASTFDLSFSYVYLIQMIGVILLGILVIRDAVANLLGLPPASDQGNS